MHPFSGVYGYQNNVYSCADPVRFARGGPTVHPDNIFVFKLIRGERIKLSLKAGHYRPTSETSLNGDSLAGR